MSFEKIGIVGAGSWGTALALVLGDKSGVRSSYDGPTSSSGVRSEHGSTSRPITLWGHNPQHIAELAARRENARYLPGVPLPETLHFTAEIEQLAGADLLVFVTPSKAVREVAARLARIAVRDDAVLLSCTKGVERGSGLRMSEILAEHFPRNQIAVLSGPSHAEEVARKMPTAMVLGCGDASLADRLQQTFSGQSLRAYTSDDIAGIELGGALKNIFALAAGVSDGLGLGDNSKAALVTRALAELVRLGAALGGRAETFHGLSGIGDLIVTCFSRHSRNRAVGERLGRGEALAAIVASLKMVAEGVPTTYSAHECAARIGIETPIIAAMRALLDGAISPREAMAKLMSRDLRAEQA